MEKRISAEISQTYDARSHSLCRATSQASPHTRDQQHQNHLCQYWAIVGWPAWQHCSGYASQRFVAGMGVNELQHSEALVGRIGPPMNA